MVGQGDGFRRWLLQEKAWRTRFPSSPEFLEQLLTARSDMEGFPSEISMKLPGLALDRLEYSQTIQAGIITEAEQHMYDTDRSVRKGALSPLEEGWLSLAACSMETTS